ncbi:regulator of nonsense transcripts 3A isoform X3 [Thrips palmi]|uniref:Regulator of nonsense transcripts 3A isoform X3 n=1 Tax=Thrips palmi TaxID=161013 RepID=A0A6P9A7E8_THRPL|nr:regulator of nonsense transcripts 3A isoform X3 [Thrips palmi]
MTETVKASQEDTQKDSTQQPSSPKTKSKAAKLSTEGNERPKSNDKVEKPPTKVVVRRLPPTMTLETFLDQVSPLPPVDYMYFVKADLSLTPNSFARAYLHFVHVADLLIFTEKFDNYVFVDSKGNEYPAIVEYAPFQRIPKQRSSRKKDPRIGTIGNDPYYLEFLEALKAEETQRKSASKTNKQHFFETSITGAVTPKVTSTPLLEFLKARRADKLRTKEDKIAERRKREVERRKARDDARITVKHGKTAEADSDIAAPTSQIKIAGHGPAADKGTKDASDIKRFSKDSSVKEIMSKRRDDDRGKAREKDRERREKDAREPQREPKRDSRRDSTKDQGPDKEKDKENQPNTLDSKSKETKRGGKSYQEERQRLNERRLAAKGMSSKPSSVGDCLDKSESVSTEEINGDKKTIAKKEADTPSESRSRPNERSRGSDKYQQQSTRESKKFEKTNKTGKDSEQKRSYDSKKTAEERYQDDSKEMKKNESNDKTDSPKEETRKKSYNQEREQRRAAAAERKNPNKREQGGSKSEMPDSKENTKKLSSAEEAQQSLDDNSSKKGGTTQEEPSRRKSGGESSNERKKGTSDSRDEKDKKDPRAERRIRNKDRPSIEIYRPGMGRFSRQRLEREKGLGKGSSTERDSPSSSPSPVPSSAKTSVISENDNE